MAKERRKNRIESSPPLLQHESSIEEIMESISFLPLKDDALLDSYAFYLSYRAQRDLYELREEFRALTWEQFLSIVRQNKQVREAAELVIRDAVEKIRIRGCFNFEAKDRPFFQDGDLADAQDENKIAACSKLYDADIGRCLILGILFKVEIAHYQRQLAQGKEYFWEEYLAELKQNSTMWDEVMLAFRDALLHLDFKTAWKSWEPFAALQFSS